MQVKKIRIKNLSCLSFHMSCSQNFFYLHCFFFGFFVVVFFFFHIGFALLVWLSNFMITLIWSCIQLLQWATGVSFYTNPLKFPETESKHLWLLCHFLFYSRFCISAPTPVTLAAIYFLKRGLGLLFSFTLFSIFSFFLKRGLGLLFSITLFYFIIIFHVFFFFWLS